MIKRLVFLLISVLVILTASGAPALAAKKNQGNNVRQSPGGASSTPIGNDVSWPQCNKNLPSNQAFGIVGINGGLANNTNPCLPKQLTWAQLSTGILTIQPAAQLYVNTANPFGVSGITDWPQNNVDSDNYDTTAIDPYGSCSSSNSIACAWQFGWNQADQDVQYRFIPSANNAHIDSVPSHYTWWLDVETGNSWESGPSGQQRNIAVLQGMAKYLNVYGAKAGLYSTSYQWGKIAGTTTTNTLLDGLDSWLPGAKSQKTARSNCSLQSLTKGGKVTTTQYVSNNLDYDYSCL
jgi:hypothetical protein